jgi:diguanylate cyclase (GGDEF)-like protein
LEHATAELEARRRAIMAEARILGTAPEASFDQVARLAAAACGCSAAWITFFDGEQEWAKAATGVSLREVPRATAASRFALDSPSVTVLRHPIVEPSPLARGLAFYAAAPIRMGGVAVGTIAVMDSEPRELSPSQNLALTLLGDLIRLMVDQRAHLVEVESELSHKGDAEQRLADVVAKLQTAHLDLQEQGLELTMANARLQKLAETDGLTGLRNHRTLFEEIQRRIGRKEPFSVVLMDLDNFKIYNDRHGHLAGDEALRVLARELESSVRGEDIAARYGGEEFALLLGDVPGRSALEIAERLRRQIERYPWSLSPLTLSAGVATSGEDVMDPETVIRRADSALYAAKRTGKNRVLAWVSG